MLSTRAGIALISAIAISVIVAVGHYHAKAVKKSDSYGSSVAHQLWHCGMHPQVIQDHPGDCPICHMALTPVNAGSPADDSTHELVVTIDPAVVQNMGIRTATVTRGPLRKTIRTVGVFRLPETGMHDVSLKVSGWIDKLDADQDGMHVVKGQPLFEVYSPDLQVTCQELISSVKAEKELDSNASAAIRSEAHALVDLAKRKLHLWDVADADVEAIAAAGESPKTVPFRSPATGHIEDKMIVQGSAVQVGAKLMRIADHSTMWLDAQLYEDQVAVVKLNQTILAAVDGAAGKSFKGTVSFIYPHVDHMSRTLTVRSSFANPDFELKPGMYATVEIATEPLRDAIQTPREAVIDTGSRQIVFVVESPGHFAVRRVKMGLVGDNDMVQIVDGLASGETVVTSGQFLMDVESRTIEATQKLNIASTEPTAIRDEMTPVSVAPAAPPTSILPVSPAPSSISPAQIATQPADVTPPLTQVFCTMTKANWLQIGDHIVNPYMGQQMSDCGEIRGKALSPPTGSNLSNFISAYLAAAAAMNADKLDGQAILAMKTASEKLEIDRHGALRDASAKLATARDLKVARLAFAAVSEQLIAVLQQSTPVKSEHSK